MLQIWQKWKHLDSCGMRQAREPNAVSVLLVQGSRLILPTGRTCVTNFLSWLHKHIIWSQFIYLFDTTFD